MKGFYELYQTVKGLLLKLILLNWLLLTASCMRNETSQNTFPLNELLHSNSNCSAPCWQNIFPGSSTIEDVERMILNMSEQELQSYRRIEIDPDFVRYSWYNETDGLFVNISVFRGVVDFISLAPITGKLVPFDPILLTPLPQDVTELQNQRQSDYKLADIFQVAGEPLEYSALLSSDYHGAKVLNLLLFYGFGIIVDNIYVEGKQKGFDFGSLDSCSIKISSDLPIQRVYFTNLTTLSDTLPSNGNRLSFFSGDIYAWNGLDNIRLSKCNS